jgi:hypothetical protein
MGHSGKNAAGKGNLRGNVRGAQRLPFLVALLGANRIMPSLAGSAVGLISEIVFSQALNALQSAGDKVLPWNRQ